jgi:hypothetical protein
MAGTIHSVKCYSHLTGKLQQDAKPKKEQRHFNLSAMAGIYIPLFPADSF